MKYSRGKQTVYGVTVDGDIYINPDVHNSESELFNTAIHEMGHVWTDYIQTTEQGRKIYKRGATLVKKTEEYKRQLKSLMAMKRELLMKLWLFLLVIKVRPLQTQL